MPQQACDAVRAAASKSIACKAQVAKEVTQVAKEVQADLGWCVAM